MGGLHFLIFGVLLVGSVSCTDESIETKELEANQYMADLNKELDRRRNLASIAEWAYASNITDANLKVKDDISAENAKFAKEKAKEIRNIGYQSFKDEDLKRQFHLASKLGYTVLPDDDYRKMLDAVAKMESNYAQVKVCSYKDRTKCDLSLEPEIEEIISKSRDPEELKYYWVEWYNKAGKPVRDHFDQYVALSKEAAQLNNFTSPAEDWLNEYEDETFEHQLENILDQMRPFYEQLHAYVRHRLRKLYGDKVVSETGPIPMHLLGNMWAQTWDELADTMLPYPNKQSIDVTEEMKSQGYTILKMFQMGDEFFQSMNMTKLPPAFWEKSILEKPKDGRELICHASAWDFYLQDDVRIKQCTRVTMDQFFVVHHELGHIQYFLQYQHLPHVYREGANPGFHEAVGDVLSISVSTPKHLEKIGLLKNYVRDDEARINLLFRKALEKIAFIPFAYTMDKYRWGIFRGLIKPEDYNCAFWRLREQYSGIEPPVTRTENDFDAAAKYHISADVEYLRYMVSYVVQFQFYKAACEKAGQFVAGDPTLPLDDCDIHGSTKAGEAFKAMLSLGASKPWPDAMEVMTGQRKMDASAIMNYFEPLKKWLEVDNKKTGAHIGWTCSEKCVKKP